MIRRFASLRSQTVLFIISIVIIIVVSLLILFNQPPDTFEQYNPWNNNFKMSSLSPFKKHSLIQGQHFKRPDCQMHPNCFGCKGYNKSDLPFNLPWDGIQNQGHIALLFITGRGEPCVNSIWERWINKEYFVAFNHGIVTLPYATNIPTEKITYDNIVPAIVKLIRTSLETPTIKGCVFISESCIPTKSPAHVYKKLIHSPSILLFVNENLDKSQFFYFLSRQAMEAIVEDYKHTKLASSYDKTMSNGGNDELLIPQILKKHPDIPTIHGNVTFQCSALNCINKENGWDTTSTKKNVSHPHYDRLSKKFASLLLSNTSLFARKFTKDTTVDGEPISSFLEKHILV